MSKNTDLGSRLYGGIDRGLRERQQSINGLARGLPDPSTLLGQASQRLDDLADRLPHGLHARVREYRRDFTGLAARLKLDELATRLPRHRASLDDLTARQAHAFKSRITSASEHLGHAASLLTSYSYQGVLARGFALVRDDAGNPVTSVKVAAKRRSLELEFADGRLSATAAGEGPARQKQPAKPKPSRNSDDDQGRALVTLPPPLTFTLPSKTSVGMISMTSEASSAIDRLLNVMAKLRDPEGGCPWDIEQTFETIAPYTIEEAYEVADAIERGDMRDLKEELGDLLLQVVYHSQMAAERGDEAEGFTFDAVAADIADKMIRRHPHVFGDTSVENAEAQSRAWEDVKAEERRLKGKAEPESLLDNVPLALPALTRAEKLQKRAARGGFDWSESSHVLDKIQEELGELKAEMDKGTSRDRLEDELGDVLLTVVNLGPSPQAGPGSGT